MDRPRLCSYQKSDRYGKRVGEPIPIKAPASTSTSADPPVEYRAITLRQLMAVEANIERRCEEEGWINYKKEKLTPKTVSLYDASKFVILQFTNDTKQSFVSRLPSTAGPQPPRFFASHWWGEAVVDFIRCLEQFIEDFSVNENDKDDRRGGGMTADTPVWICAYSNNQHALDEDTTEELRDSGFTKAMRVAQNRTIAIIDKEGIAFSRIWCIFELFLTLRDVQKKDNEEESNDGLWAVYTAKTHKYNYRCYEEKREAVGIISGGATGDLGFTSWIASREEHFPVELINKSLDIKVEDAKATEKSDRAHILNLIRGSTGDAINDTPPTMHDSYTAVDNALKSTFAITVATLRVAANEDDRVWNNFLTTLSKEEKEITMHFDFSEVGWRDLTADRATQLVAHLPLTIYELIIDKADFGRIFWETLSQRVEKCLKIKVLEIWDTKVGMLMRLGEVGDNVTSKLRKLCELNIR